MRNSALLLAFVALGARAATAQVRPDSLRRDTTRAADSLFAARLAAIVVTTSRVDVSLRDNPAATKVVASEVLGAMPRGIAVDEALDLVPGVKVDNQADGKRVHLSIRGQGILSEHGIRGTKVLLDGLPLNDPSGFASDFYDVDWATVGVVEVQRGPEASLYGGGSSAGVLSIATADGAAAAVSPMVSTAAGSNGFFRATGQAGGSLADGSVNYRTSYTHSEGDGYRVHTGFHGDNLYGKARWRLSSGLTLTPVLAYTRFYNQNAEGLNLAWLAQDRRQANPDALTYNEYQDTKRVTGGLVGLADLGSGAQLSFDGFLRHTGYLESVPSSVIHRAMFSPGGTVQLTVPAATGALLHHLSVGSDVQLQDIDERTHPNLGAAVEGAALLSDQTLHQTGAGFFALDRIDVGERWSVMLNLRYDQVGNRLADHLKSGGVDLSGRASFSAVTGRVGATWAPSRVVSLYANVGQGFLPPATEELEANPVQIGGFNGALKAALSLGEEVGVRGVFAGGMGALMYDLTVFHLGTERDFDRYRVASRPLETFYRNMGTTRRYGVETSLGWAPVAAVLVQLAYTWSDFKYINDSSAYGPVHGHWLPNSPEHQLAADVAYGVTRHLTVGVSADALSRWYVDPGNVASVDGYTLFHARVAYRLRAAGTPVEASVSVRNIFGVKYMGFTEPDPDGNSYQPAAEREVFVGLKLAE